MKVFTEKRKELSQTIVSLIDSIRKEEGCRRCDFCQSMEDESELSIFEEWNTREDLNSHLKSERFRILRGAMNLLREPCEMMVYTVQAGIKKQKRGVSYQFDERYDRSRHSVVKPNYDRSNTMKSGMRDKAEGKWHQVKGKVKEIAGKVRMNPGLEAEGKEETRAGHVQEKIGEIKKVVGK